MDLDFIKEQIDILIKRGDISIADIIVMLAEIIKENNII